MEIKYLGLIMIINGIKMDLDKIGVILEWKAPTTVKYL